jgi:hypothetical protein
MSLGFSILLVHDYGLDGVLLGSTAGLIFIGIIWRPYFVFKNAFEWPLKEYLLGFFSSLIKFAIFFITTQVVFLKIISTRVETILQWLSLALLTSIMAIIVYSIVLFICDKYYRALIKRLRQSLFKKL